MIRPPDLEEWFLGLQIRAIAREHVHVVLYVDVDVSGIERAAAAAGVRPSYTAVGVKAAAILARRHPEVNRMLFHTPIGRRVVDFPYVAVNLPVKLARSGHLAATVLRDADQHAVGAIAEHIHQFRQTELADLPIGRFFVGNHNTWWRRLVLRGIHWCAWRLPWLYLRGGGGGISVSSLLNHRSHGHRVHVTGLGPTAITLTLASLQREAGRVVLSLGVALDHALLPGDEAGRVVADLVQILGDPALFFAGPDGPHDAGVGPAATTG